LFSSFDVIVPYIGELGIGNLEKSFRVCGGMDMSERDESNLDWR
jgi:hypothetical protein